MPSSRDPNLPFSISLTEILLVFLFALLLAAIPQLRDQEAEISQQQALVVALQSKVNDLENMFDGLEQIQARAENDEDFIRMVRDAARSAGEVSALTAERDALAAQLAEERSNREDLQAQLARQGELLGDEPAQVLDRLTRAEAENANLRRQLGRGGADFPPCWINERRDDPDYGKAEYLLDIEIWDDHLIVMPGWPEQRRTDALALPSVSALTQAGELTGSRFLELSGPLLAHSRNRERECRHFVRIRDRTLPESKAEFKSGLLTVEAIFYKYLVREES